MDIRVIAVKELADETGLQRIAEAVAYYLDSIVKQDMVPLLGSLPAEIKKEQSK